MAATTSFVWSSFASLVVLKKSPASTANARVALLVLLAHPLTDTAVAVIVASSRLRIPRLASRPSESRPSPRALPYHINTKPGEQSFSVQELSQPVDRSRAETFAPSIRNP